MLCPACQVELKMTERQSIEIDYCPQCRGVWLDRGELDKIIERTAALEAPRAAAPEPARREEYRDDRKHDRGYGDRHYKDDDHRRGDYHPRRKKSFLSELLDF